MGKAKSNTKPSEWSVTLGGTWLILVAVSRQEQDSWAGHDGGTLEMHPDCYLLPALNAERLFYWGNKYHRKRWKGPFTKCHDMDSGEPQEANETWLNNGMIIA